MDEMQMDVVIVGGGSAGLSAALMLGRARRSVLVLDGDAPRNRFVEHMHAVLGHDGYSPHALLADGRRELERYGVEVVMDAATDAALTDEGLVVTTASGRTIITRRMLVATGLRDELPDIRGLREQWGRGVVMCPYCDGWEVRDRRIGVIATGPMSTHQAQLLRQWSSEVTYFTRGLVPLDDETRRGLDARGILVDDDAVERVVTDAGALVAVETSAARVPVDSIFVGPTPVPLDDLLRRLDARRADVFGGSWVEVDPTGRTSVPGVWAAGNVVSPMANVPASMGAGSMAGAMINADLVTDDIERAVTASAVPVG